MSATRPFFISQKEINLVDHMNEELIDDLHLFETYAARALLAGQSFSTMRANLMRACSVIDFDESDSIKEWVREETQPDERIRLVTEQSCETGSGEPDPALWPAAKDIAKRLTPAQLRGIFDGLHVLLEGNDAKKLVALPGGRVKAGSSISIEHFYPQSGVLWSNDLADWGVDPELMVNRLHALGNISVLPIKVNTALSNKAFADKQKDLASDGVESKKLNLPFFQAEKWTNEEIDERTKKLVKKSLELWKIP